MKIEIQAVMDVEIERIRLQCQNLLEDRAKHTEALARLGEERARLQQLAEAADETLMQLVKESQHYQDEVNCRKATSCTAELKSLRQKLGSLYSVLGYRLTEIKIKDDDNHYLLTLHYNDTDTSYVVFQMSVADETYELETIQPQPTQYDAIKLWLQQTQDTGGLLSNLRAFFDSATQTAQETNSQKST